MTDIKGNRGKDFEAPLSSLHPDEAAVDRFSSCMKAKLEKKRAEGRGGWEDRMACSRKMLSDMLCTHIEKGDPVDVANFAMMLHQRGEAIDPSSITALIEEARAQEREACAKMIVGLNSGAAQSREEYVKGWGQAMRSAAAHIRTRG